MFDKFDVAVPEKGNDKSRIDLKRLVYLRKECGFTEKELASILGVTQQAISLNLQKAKEKGLLDENIGTNIVEEYDLVEDEEIQADKKELKYRCLKCHNYLVPLKEDKEGYSVQTVFTHKGKVVTYDKKPLLLLKP